MMRNRGTEVRGPGGDADHGIIAGMAIAAGITIALFPPLTGADLYLSADRSGILPVNATAISFLSLSSAFGLVLLAGLVRDRGRRLYQAYEAAAPILFAFAMFTVVRTAGGFLPDAEWDGGGKLILLAVYNFVVVLMFSVGIASAPTFRQYHRAILSVCLLAVAASIFMDVFDPGTFSKRYERPAGFMANANGGAATATILAVVTVDWTRSRATDMLLWLIAGTAVVATLSRGGMILFAVTFLLYNVVVARSGLQLYAKRFSLVLIAAATVMLLYSIADLGSTVYSAKNGRMQLLAALLSGESAVLTEDSRVELVWRYIDRISERPILGYGSGYTVAQGKTPHNTFLMMWVENGLPGLAGYLILLAVAFWYFRRCADRGGQALCVGVFVLSMFEGDATDMRPLVVALGLLSVLAVPERCAGLERTQLSAVRRLALLGRRPNRGVTLRGASGTVDVD